MNNQSMNEQPILTLTGGAIASPGCDKPQFQPPLLHTIPAHPKYAQSPGLYGFGAARCGDGDWCAPEETSFWRRRFNFNIIDSVRVPALSPGHYTLSFRWDCEQTPQIWNSCSDVLVTN